MRSLLTVFILMVSANAAWGQADRRLTDEPSKKISSRRKARPSIFRRAIDPRAANPRRRPTPARLVRQKPKTAPKTEGLAEPRQMEEVHPHFFYARNLSGRNDWFQQYRMFQPRQRGPFRYTHPLIPRWTRIPLRNKWIWIENPQDLRAEHARFGNGYQSRRESHRPGRKHRAID